MQNFFYQMWLRFHSETCPPEAHLCMADRRQCIQPCFGRCLKLFPCLHKGIVLKYFFFNYNMNIIGEGRYFAWQQVTPNLQSNGEFLQFGVLDFAVERPITFLSLFLSSENYDWIIVFENSLVSSFPLKPHRKDTKQR